MKNRRRPVRHRRRATNRLRKTPPAFSQAPWLADMADWSARRTSRLTHREWMELVAAGSEGGQYRSPVAGFRIEELGQRLVFQLRPHILDAEGKELTGYRLSETLLEMADAHSVNYRPEGADRVVSVSVQDIYTVEVTLRRAHVRPEALLRFPIAGLAGPYRLLAAQGRETIFVVNPQYFALTDAQPKEIVEVAFDSPSQALAALRAGKVDLVDRAPPPALARKMLADLEGLCAADIPNSWQEGDKVLLLAVRTKGQGYLAQAREWDVRTRLFGTTASVDLQQPTPKP